MYLSNREIQQEIESGGLIFDPAPEVIDPSSVDLDLDRIEEARIWDIEKFRSKLAEQGIDRPELRIAKYDLSLFSADYLKEPPDIRDDPDGLIVRRSNQCIVRPGGFALWQTKETVGTHSDKGHLICFVDGKSTRARAGIIVHLTAPTIHASWSGKITLEIANLGPFDLVLQEGDVIAQLTVARLSSVLDMELARKSVTLGQTRVSGDS